MIEQEKKYIQQVLADYRLAFLSRQASLIGRKEVLTGKAKFGIFGGGKELAQIALAKYFENGDFRSGYYRDQTLMMAIEALTVQQFFAQLYAHTDVEADPSSAGRQMNGHFATRSLNDDGSWKNLTEQKNSSADISPTAGQMPRLLGLAQASKVYRNLSELKDFTQFSQNGNEVAFGTIGDASTSEGLFWETINAAGVLQVPMVISVWDDGYGISVPKKYQTTKESISEVLKGLQRTDQLSGFEMFNVKGWDYSSLCKTYEEAVAIAREKHIPALVHVEEIIQPQGHSTSGSHERYKSKKKLEWDKEFDCLNQFKKWIVEDRELATVEELDQIEQEAIDEIKISKREAWKAQRVAINIELKEAKELIAKLVAESQNAVFIQKELDQLSLQIEPIRKDILSVVRKSLRYTRGESFAAKTSLIDWLTNERSKNEERFSQYLYNETEDSSMKVEHISPEYSTDEMVDGRIILRDNFETIFKNNPLVLTFGEDTGKIGGVNQGMEGMQEKFGEVRVSDTGIREATIIGQGIGMAMRGLRPIAEIQYLDYLLYALQTMSDDLATVQYRTKGGQKAPLIVRTRGHRLEGIWHSGSPMGTIINALRGVYVCVPRNMTQAAGFYNTLLKGEDPALVIEPLNGYRTKEKKPSNLGDFTTPLGIPEVVREGNDITVVSYGSTFNLCLSASNQLEELGISAEFVDVRTLLPFDINHTISESIQKTNRVIFVDEDVEGGASAFMLSQVLDKQDVFQYLDAKPKVLSARDHRPAYATDGDYFSKPNTEDFVEAVYEIMYETDPKNYPSIY